MGNQESLISQEVLPLSPVIKKIRNSLHLNITTNKTSSFIHQDFASQIKKTSGIISRINNPFCPLTSTDPKNDQQLWLSCCLISPVMAIALPKTICDDKGKYVKNVKILGVTKKEGKIQVPVKDAVIIKQNSICLLLLSKASIDLGWVGISCINNKEEIQSESYKIINHPKAEVDSQNNLTIYQQELNKGFYKFEKDFIGTCKSMPGSLLLKIIDKKPYIIGVQINERQAQFITKDVLKKINQTALKLINPKRQRQILQNIDIQQLELMEKL